PAHADEVSASEAIAELALRHAPECGLNPGAPCLPAPVRRLRHRLNLHGVHARQPSDALLVELDGLPVLCSVARTRLELLQLAVEDRLELGPKLVVVDIHPLSSPTHDRPGIGTKLIPVSAGRGSPHAGVSQ